MIRDFLNFAGTDEELAERKRIFKAMNIHKVDPTFVDEHCGRYPAIHLSLKDVRPVTLDKFRHSMEQAVSTVIDEWEHVISDTSRTGLNHIRDQLNRKIDNMHNSIDDSVMMPAELVDYLSRYYNAECIVLVDEFDTPVMKAAENIREEIKHYMRKLLSPLAKGNNNVRKFIMVGIDPANLNIFGSGMNNCIWYPLHEGVGCSAQDASAYQFAFGFAEDEVRALIERAVARLQLGTDYVDKLMTIVRTWYNGYHACKGVRLYNPWSVMSYLQETTTSCDECMKMIAEGSAEWYWNDTNNRSFINSMYKRVRRADNLHELIQSLIASFPAHQGGGAHLDTIQRAPVRFSSDDNDDGVSGSGGGTADLASNLRRSGPTGTGTGNSSATPVPSAEWTITIAKSVQGVTDRGPLSINDFRTKLYYRGYLAVSDTGKHIAIPNREVMWRWVEMLNLHDAIEEFVGGMDGKATLVDLLLSGDYATFIAHVEQVLSAQNQDITVYTYERTFQMLLSIMVSVYLDPRKYDILRECPVNNGYSDIVIRPRHAAGSGGGDGDGSWGIHIEAKRAGPRYVDRTHRLTDEDMDFIRDPTNPREDRARRLYGEKTYKELRRLLIEGFEQTLDTEYLEAFDRCCDRVIVVIAAFSGKNYQFRFEHFKREESRWNISTSSQRGEVDSLACPFNWPE
ncbi:hypothetical protein EV182_001924 [Spiromyces aspiralis]|uniref:Uncharacterized protein n=1 Tax=Spiromyces aspiralis TaxID=68401 RepID=A0ACC1HSG2_9FUNG|nr:hypothetical protein EV182_001924 [Spiromyces aspiralis]